MNECKDCGGPTRDLSGFGTKRYCVAECDLIKDYPDVSDALDKLKEHGYKPLTADDTIIFTNKDKIKPEDMPKMRITATQVPRVGRIHNNSKPLITNTVTLTPTALYMLDGAHGFLNSGKFVLKTSHRRSATEDSSPLIVGGKYFKIRKIKISGIYTISYIRDNSYFIENNTAGQDVVIEWA